MKKILILLIVLFSLFNNCFAVISFRGDPNSAIANSDTSNATTDYFAYTYVNSTWWVVSKSVDVADVKTWTYAVGANDYATAWVNHTTLNYYDWHDTYANPN